jgi:hypothetical protein
LNSSSTTTKLTVGSSRKIVCDEFVFDRANWTLTYTQWVRFNHARFCQLLLAFTTKHSLFFPFFVTRYAARPLPDEYYVQCAAQWKRQSKYEAQHETKLIVYPDLTQKFTKSACTLDVPNCPAR